MLSKLLLLSGGCIGLSMLGVGTASAQRAQTYVASTGSDNNTCTQTAPCRTLGGAFAKTPTAGQINILDSAEYGPSFVINKSIYIEANGVTANINASQLPGAISVNAPNSIVSIKGLTIDGSGNLDGIYVSNASDVEIEDCEIDGTIAAVFVASSAATRVHVYKSRLHNNSTGVSLEAGSVVNGVVIDESTLDSNSSANIYINGVNGAVLVGNSSIQGGTALTIVGGQPTVQSYGDNRISSAFPATIVQRQ